MEKFEFEWHKKLSSMVPPPEGGVGVGDDCAVLKNFDQRIVVTTDTLSEGVHFVSAEICLALIGRKAIAVSLSDIAAMGATPRYATIQLTLPKSFSLSDTEELMSGCIEIANRFAVSIVGGDTNRWDGKLVIGSTIIGAAPNEPWFIGGAMPGDILAVTGRLGGSLLHHHLSFEPRCDLAQRLSSRFKIHAATDISDSLTVDLAAITEASNCGAVLESHKIPISEDAFILARTSGHTPLEHALYDGEDFELLLAIPPQTWTEIQTSDLAASLFPIGQFVKKEGLVLRTERGDMLPVEIRGYEH